MSEWPMVKLGEVCSISIGKTPARKEPRYWGEGLPWLSIKDMNQGSLILKTTEAYSAAGETWFGWWLVEHYLPYHVNCPDGCVSGEPTRGRKDPPYFQMSYGSLDCIPDLVDPLVESPLPA